MGTIVRMPEVLTGAGEGSLSSWHVAVGDEVTVGQPLAEVETEKAIVECVTEEAGRVARLLVELNEPVATGTPIVLLAGPGESIEEAIAAHDPSTPAPTLVAEGAPESSSAPSAPDGSERQTAATAAVTVPAVTEASEDAQPAAVAAPTTPNDVTGVLAGPDETALTDRRFATPLVRRLAREQAMNLDLVPGSGPRGRITRRDLERFMARRPAAPANETAPATVPVPTDKRGPTSERARTEPEPPAGPARPAAVGAHCQEYTDIPHSGMRRAIARRLTESKSSVPHFYLIADCRADALLDLRRTLNGQIGVKVSVNDFVVKAVAGAFVDVPEANVVWTDDAVRQFSTVSIAVAVAIDGGLVTPVLRNVEQRSVSDISRTIAELVGRAREGRLKQAELEGGSFTVSNLGMFGIERFSAIINPPQSGILAVGAATRRPVVTDDGDMGVGAVMTVTLSGDHRALDGALAARWLSAFQHRIEHPMTILA